MTVFMGAHIAAGLVALIAGATAVAAPKGRRLHARAGTAFVGAMLLLWVSATTLHVQQGKPGAAVADIFIAYFVLTSWSAARRRDGTAGRLEIAACAVAFLTGALVAWAAVYGPADPTPVGRGPLYVLAGFCLAAGAADLSVVLRRRLTGPQRIARHLWRMCSGFFVATGSFFLGQQDVMPEAVRGSPVLVLLAFAPFIVMALWLARLPLAPGLRRRFAAFAEAGPR